MTTPSGRPPSFDPPDPLARIADGLVRIASECAALRDLASALSGRDADDPERAAARRIRDALDRLLRDHADDVELDLLPALEESMAGSDAVCVRETAAGVEASQEATAARWAALRIALAALADGDRTDLPRGEAESFASDCERHAAFGLRELLPMSERLLDADALSALARSMRRRRGLPDA